MEVFGPTLLPSSEGRLLVDIAVKGLLVVLSVIVMVLYISADKTGLAAVWGVTTGVWVGNLIISVMER